MEEWREDKCRGRTGLTMHSVEDKAQGALSIKRTAEAWWTEEGSEGLMRSEDWVRGGAKRGVTATTLTRVGDLIPRRSDPNRE